MKSRFILASLLFFSYWLLTFSVDDDIKCLQGIQKSLDADRELAWSFTNTTVPSICKLNGVTCWNQQETRIISLSLASMKLSGQVPESLKLCHSLQIVDLSSNALSGPIPPQLCSWLPYITQLDLSNNRLSGPIPAEIVECKFLNKLNLSNNKFSGPIPFEISRLGRLKEFSVADNDFSGPMPSDLARFRAESFEGNNRLCGEPLGKCGGLSGKRVGIIIAACVIGALGSMSIGLLIRWSFFDRVDEFSKELTACEAEAGPSAAESNSNGTASSPEDVRTEEARHLNRRRILLTVFVAVVSVSAMYILKKEPLLLGQF